jgi:hypothetical protein
MHAVLGINSEAINRIEFYSEQICSSLSPIFCLFPLPPSPRREGGNPQYINDLSPSLLGEGFRERQLSERYRGSTEKHREKIYRNNSNIGSPVQAFGYGILHNVDSVAAISVILTCRVTVALFTVHPYQIKGT